MKCTNCGSSIEENAKFCPNCGTKIEIKEKVETDNDDKIVDIIDNDESNQTDDIQETNLSTSETVQSDALESIKEEHNELIASKKEHKKHTLIGIIVVVLIIVIGLASGYFLFFNNNSNNAVEPIVYATDTDLVVVDSLGSDKSKSKTIIISDDYAGTYLLSENFKYIVYSESREEHDDDHDGYTDRTTYDVYCKKVKDVDEEPILIAKNVSSIDLVTGDIEKVVYTKNGDLYSANINGDSTKIAKDANCYEILKDKKTAFCTNYNEGEYDYESESYGPSSNDLKYVDLENGDTIKICDAVEDFTYDNNTEKVYYTKNDKLYVSDKGGKEKSIAKNVISYAITNDKLYYLCEGKDYIYYDFVKDSYKESDNKITQPVWEDYAPKYENYQKQVYDDFWQEYYTETDYDAYNKAYENAEKKYNEDYDKYDEACSRIEIREELMESCDFGLYNLFYYDGNESTQIAEGVCDSLQSISEMIMGDSDTSSRCDAITTTMLKTPLKNIKKIDIVKIMEGYDLDDYFEENLVTKSIIASPNGIMDIDIKKMSFSSAYYYDNNYYLFYSLDNAENKEDNTAIYTLPMNNAKKIDEASVLKEQVFGITWIDKKMVTFCDYDYKTETATMEFDGNKINDVYPFEILQQQEGSFVYSTDYDKESYESTINVYSNGKTTKLADDIRFGYWCFAEKDGKYLAITDYDTDDRNGTLICIDGENTFEIDSNVTSINGSNFRYTNNYMAYTIY